MAPVKVDPDKVRAFKDAESFYKWLGKNHDKAGEIWIKIHKVDSGLKSITPKQAIDVVLCWGWIDGDNVARLIEEGRMTAHGLREVDQAKSDGRWARAYNSKDMTMPADLKA